MVPGARGVETRLGMDILNGCGDGDGDQRLDQRRV